MGRRRQSGETEPRPEGPAAEMIDLHSEFAEAVVAMEAEPEKAQALLLCPASRSRG